jgi:hypothetical protein
MGFFSGGGNAPFSGGFHMPFFGSSLNVGALVEPLTSQMAEYLGVSGGLMVRQVARKSEAASAGLKAFDVILKVGSEPIATLSDWERALHANQGKPVQVTVLRDRKQQTLTLQVDSKRHSLLDGDCPPDDCALMAEISPEQADEFRQQAEALRDSLKAENFKIDQKQLDQLKQQMEELRKSFKPEDFKIDQKQLDQLKQQMNDLKRQMEELKARGFDGHI